MLYEWLFTVLNTRADVNQNPSPATSAAIAAQQEAYQASLGLSGLTAATMLDAIKAEVVNSAEIYLKASPANTIPALGGNFVITGGGPGGGTPRTFVNDWIDVDNAIGFTSRTCSSTIVLGWARYCAQVRPVRRGRCRHRLERLLLGDEVDVPLHVDRAHAVGGVHRRSSSAPTPCARAATPRP